MRILDHVQAVVFDLDGLMFNTEDLYDLVGEILLRPRGHVYTPELKRRMMGLPGRVSLQVMIDHHGLNATVEQLQAETDAAFPAILDEHLAPMPGLLDLLGRLEEAGIPKAIATSSRRWYLSTVLSKFDLEPHFEFLLTSEDVACGKPDPEVYLMAAERFGLSPGRLMVLEDSEIGCRAAVAARAWVVAVPGVHSKDHCFDGVQLVADSLGDERIVEALGLAPGGTAGS